MIVNLGDTGILLLSTFIELFAVTISVFLARRFLDRHSIVSLGLKFSWRTPIDLLAGIFITFFQMGLVYLVFWSQGWMQFQGFAWHTETIPRVICLMLVMLLQFILVGWNEELLSRGYHLQTIASGFDRSGQGTKGLPLLIGVLISSVVFGLLHIFNPNATWISTLGIFLAGLFLSLPYLLTRQLWLSIGLHIGWNLFEGVVFGFPVSGINVFTLAHVTVTGPNLWTGGAFRPESGLVIVPVLAIGAVLVYAYCTLARHPATGSGRETG
jgi:hypothetical protein